MEETRKYLRQSMNGQHLNFSSIKCARTRARATGSPKFYWSHALEPIRPCAFPGYFFTIPGPLLLLQNTDLRSEVLLG